MTFSLIRGDATSIPLADDSVDAVISSPPYYALRSYTDGGEHYDGQIGSEATPQAFLDALWAVTAECRRVLKPSGSMFVNLGDKYSGSDGASGAPSKQNVTASHARQRFRGDFGGVPAKSLMGLPWRYAIGCIDPDYRAMTCRPRADDRYPDMLVEETPDRWVMRAEVIWSKPNGLPESVTDRVRRSHEQWFHFTKEPRYFSAVDEVREAHGRDARPAEIRGDRPVNASRGPDGGIRWRQDGSGADPLGKLPGSVWSIPTEPLRVPDHIGVDHFAAFPSEWPRRLILGWSPSGVCVACGEGRRPVVATGAAFPRDEIAAGRNGKQTKERGDAATVNNVNGQEYNAWRAANPHTITGYACACPDTTAPTTPAVVLDPFCGTGTTPAVAHALGRHGIGIDLSADYLRLAEWRCNDPALRAKVLRVDKPKAVPDGQLDIFGGAA